MLFISAHEQLRLRYGARTLPPSTLKERKKKRESLSFKTSSRFQGLFFLPEKYIFCRLKAPTEVSSGEGFENAVCAHKVFHWQTR